MERNIHQIWFDWGKPEPPPAQQGHIEKWKGMHPGWTHRLWGEPEARAFISKHMPPALRVYDTLAYNIQRCDFFRLIAVYELGGFYIDADVSPKRSLEPLRSYDLVLAGTPHGGVTNYFFGAKAGNGFIKRIIDRIIREHPRPRSGFSALSRGYYILCSTGPYLFKNEFQKNGPGGGKTIRLDPSLTSSSDMYGAVLRPPASSGGAYMDHEGKGMWFNMSPSEELWMYMLAPGVVLLVCLLVVVCTAMTFGLRDNRNFQPADLKTQMQYSYAAIGLLVATGVPAVVLLAVGLAQDKEFILLAATALGSLSVILAPTLLLLAWAVLPLSRTSPKTLSPRSASR